MKYLHYFLLENILIAAIFGLKRGKQIIVLYITSLFFFSPNTHAAIGGAEVEKSKENVSIITSMFTTEMLLNFVFALFVVILTFAMSKFVTSRFVAMLESKYSGEESGREELVGVISRTVNITVLFIGFSITLSILGVDIGIFMGGIGFGIGFTMKSFLTNFVSGIMMVTQGEYHNGDLIEIEGNTGTITRINALYTTIEQFDGVLFHVPNIKFMEENVSNYTTNDKRRGEVKIMVDYEVDLLKAKKIVLKVLENFPTVLPAPSPDILVEKLDDNGVMLLVRYWVPTKEENFVQTKSNITETINIAFKQYGINIPFQQFTLSNRDDFKINLEK